MQTLKSADLGSNPDELPGICVALSKSQVSSQFQSCHLSHGVHRLCLAELSQGLQGISDLSHQARCQGAGRHDIWPNPSKEA